MEYGYIDSDDIYYGDHPDFEGEPEATIDGGHGRWHRYETRIYKRKSDGTYWSTVASLGATENQEDIFDELPIQVNRVETTVTRVEVSWEPVQS